jgi:hypothetical protein
MKGLIITVIAAIALATAATSMQRSHSLATNHQAGLAGIPSLQEMQSVATVNKLPAQDFEDRSLVFPRESGR